MANNNSSYIENGSATRPPKFDSKEFQTWKSRMMLHFESIDPLMPGIILNGPYVPSTSVETPASDTTAASSREVLKTPSQWTDEDKRKVGLDVKARYQLAISLPNSVYNSISRLNTAQKIWDALDIAYEGKEEVKQNNIIALKRQYELFFCYKGEALVDMYTRFTALINDLAAMDVIIDVFELTNKFVDSLPPSWESVATSLKVTHSLKNFNLASLYGALMNHEKSKALLDKNIKENWKHPENQNSALVATEPRKKHSKALVVYKPRTGSEESDECEEEESEDESETSYDDDDVENFAEGMAMLANKFRRFNRRKGGSKFRFSKGASSSKFDRTKSSKAECYNCGRLGHYAADCEQKKKPTQADTFSKAAKYKAKYKAMKAEMKSEEKKKKPEIKGLIAESHCWSDYESSSSSSSESDDDCKGKGKLCLMAKNENSEVVEVKTESTFLDDMREADTKMQKEDWKASMLYKVENFRSYTDNEKAEMFDYLRIDLGMAEKREDEFKNTVEELKSKINVLEIENKCLLNDKLELESKVYASNVLLKEAAETKDKFINLKKVVDSWCRSAQRTAKCVEEQIPHQVQAIIGGDYAAAAAIAEVTMMDPILENATILPETFATVVAGKKVLTNKFVKAGAPVEPFLSILEETKAGSSSSSINELTVTPVSVCANDISLSPEPKANVPKVIVTGNFPNLNAGGKKKVNIDNPTAEGKGKANAGNTEEPNAGSSAVESNTSTAGANQKIKTKAPKKKAKQPAGKPAQGKKEVITANLTETQVLTNKVDQLTTQLQMLLANSIQHEKPVVPSQPAANPPAQAKPKTKTKNRKCYTCGEKTHMAHQCQTEYCMIPRALLTQYTVQPTQVHNPNAAGRGKKIVNPVPVLCPTEPIQGWVPKKN